MRAGRCLVGVLVAACGHPAIRGGSAVPAGSESRGQRLWSYHAEACRDSAGSPVAWDAELDLRRVDGLPVLVETRPGYDSLLLSSVTSDGADLTFQIAVADTVREVRLPADGSPGTMQIAVRAGDAVLHCRLQPRER